jgi:citrate lyase subunit beta/citryl-CoA lyase
MSNKLQHPLAIAQAFLFVPGNRPERFEKALATGSPGIIIDLEDAVPMDEKNATRLALATSLPKLLEKDAHRLVVRINAFGTEWFEEDLKFLSKLPQLAAVILPKTESTEQLDIVAQSIAPSTLIIPMIETAQGIVQTRSIAAHPKSLRLTLGNIDLQADLGLSCDTNETEIFPVRFEITLATRLAEIASPIDGVTTDIENPDSLAIDTYRAKRLGFGAKLCIHPKQVAGVIQCFRPSEAEIEKAKRIVEADQGSNGGAVKLDGKMVDRPVVLLAKKILKLAEQS